MSKMEGRQVHLRNSAAYGLSHSLEFNGWDKRYVILYYVNISITNKKNIAASLNHLLLFE